MNKSSRFWDRIAERYERKPVADEAAYQAKLQFTRAYFKPDWLMLEFGCGTGSTAISHAPHVQSIHAIDSSEKMIAIAREKANAARVQNVMFEQSAIEEFEGADQSFDAILGLSILHLLENKEAVISKVFRLLKPGGIFVTNTMCLGETMKFLKWIAPIGRVLGLIPLVRIFTTRELEDSMTGAGFEIDRLWQPAKGKALFMVAKKAG